MPNSQPAHLVPNRLHPQHKGINNIHCVVIFSIFRYKKYYVIFCGPKSWSDTYLKKSSLQNNWPFLAKHLSVSCTLQSLHCRHLACHVLSATFSINLSKISSWHPPHFGIVAGRRKIIISTDFDDLYSICFCCWDCFVLLRFTQMLHMWTWWRKFNVYTWSTL